VRTSNNLPVQQGYNTAVRKRWKHPAVDICVIRTYFFVTEYRIKQSVPGPICSQISNRCGTLYLRTLPTSASSYVCRRNEAKKNLNGSTRVISWPQSFEDLLLQANKVWYVKCGECDVMTNRSIEVADLKQSNIRGGLRTHTLMNQESKFQGEQRLTNAEKKQRPFR